MIFLQELLRSDKLAHLEEEKSLTTKMNEKLNIVIEQMSQIYEEYQKGHDVMFDINEKLKFQLKDTRREIV